MLQTIGKADLCDLNVVFCRCINKGWFWHEKNFHAEFFKQANTMNCVLNVLNYLPPQSNNRPTIHQNEIIGNHFI